MICNNSICTNILVNKNSSFCSSNCFQNYTRESRIQAWLDGSWDGCRSSGALSSTIRNFLLEESNYTCSLCGWNAINKILGYSPVEIDHIDGNYSNNMRENLRVICPNCHSLSDTYKALNKDGRGHRAWRAKYNQYDLISEVKEKSTTNICPVCSKTKSRGATMCSSCRSSEIENNSDYPSVVEMVNCIKSTNVLSYAKSLGKSDNAVRKYLRRRGIETSEL